MKRILLFSLLFLSVSQLSVAQNKVSVIKASSILVDIRDGDNFNKGAWKIAPAANPDIYKTSSKSVTFYTDIDSISFEIDPKVGTYNFVILLNNKDSARTQIQYQIPYIDKLRKAKQYNISDERYIPEFTYQSQDDSTLVRIKRQFKLDSVAGHGNEISKILNLMHWVHNVVKHDGNSSNPTNKNAIDLIKVCKTDHRGVNCRMMATILNDCYLSMGIESRYVTCMPRETNFSDCHVINMVYSNDLNKWLWMDPTFDAYVMNEVGVLLGIDEVRERLISGKTLILSPDANWNRQFSQTKENYLDKYMVKNLYRLQCPVNSEYNLETIRDGKEITYVELLPLDGLEQTPQKSQYNNNKIGVKYIYYKSNNPDLFWSKPE